MEMQDNKKNVLLVSMPFADTSIPSIQLGLLESVLKNHQINAQSLHLYVKAADYYGLHNYNNLISMHSDASLAEMIFTKYIYSMHWSEKKEQIKDFYEKNIAKDGNLFSFEDYEKVTDEFFNHTISNIKWDTFDVIGFTLNYGQILPSLAVAKYLKTNFPSITIICGGSAVTGDLGTRFIDAFPWIDYVVSGEGEEALVQFINDPTSIGTIPNLIYRKDDTIIKNNTAEYIDLNTLPYPDFTSYFQLLNTCHPEIQQYYHLYGRIPIELSRGCWWNKCSFCNLNVQHKKYREKMIDRFCNELEFLSNTYKMLTFQVIANTLPFHDYRQLCHQLTALKKDFNLYIEARAGRLQRIDYSLLKKAGFHHIQTGIESFSSSYLKKMNKGVNLIDNIAVLKYCKEQHIQNHYNIITQFPNEDENDFLETKKTIDVFQQYLDPPQISKFIITYGSTIYDHLDLYNIKKVKPTKTDTLKFPTHILQKNFMFYYQFEKESDTPSNDWISLIETWKKDKKHHEQQCWSSDESYDHMVFFYIDGKEFLKIYDKRFGGQIDLYTLNSIERKIFLACQEVLSFNKLKEIFYDTSEEQVKNILSSFVEQRICFKENDLYLSLPIQLNSRFYSNEININEKFLEDIPVI